MQHVTDETLPDRLDVCASLEAAILRVEADERVLAAESDEMDALGDRVADFLQSQIQLPGLSAFDLTAFHRQLEASRKLLALDLMNSRDEFFSRIDEYTPVPEPENEPLERERLAAIPEREPVEELQSFGASVLQSDQNVALFISGVAHEENTDTIYFTDSSKINSFDLKTERCSQVHTKVF